MRAFGIREARSTACSGADHILVGRYDECRCGDRGDQSVGPVGEAREHELPVEVEHAFGVRGVTADRKVRLAIGPGKSA